MGHRNHKLNVIGVLLAFNHELIRAGVRSLLEQIEGVEVVAEVAAAHDLLPKLKGSRVDLILLDILMPGLGGIDLPRLITGDFLPVRTIIVTERDCPDRLQNAIALGAAGYLSKNSNLNELVLAIKTVAGGERYVSPDIARTELMGPRVKLTHRQQEVLERISRGRSTKQIAEDLGISVKTVETFRAQIQERLDIHNLVGLVRYALRIGLASQDD